MFGYVRNVSYVVVSRVELSSKIANVFGTTNSRRLRRFIAVTLEESLKVSVRHFGTTSALAGVLVPLVENSALVLIPSPSILG